MVEMTVNERIEVLLSESRSFFVIDPTGILQHYEDFLDSDDDPDLFAGLFAAVNVYAKELNAGNIQTATLEEHKFVFAHDSRTGTLIVMDVNSSMSDDNGQWLINQILARFAQMEMLKSSDLKGNISLETLFSERGKTINWETIQAIRESAVETQIETMDIVETLNLSRINLRNKFWARVRKMLTALVENQTGLNGLIMIMRNKNELNKLYCGRDGFESLGDLYNHLLVKFEEGTVGQELETELIQIGDLYCSIYTLFIMEGGLLAVTSTNSSLITRLNTQFERLISSVERLSMDGF
ncbi:MAG: hypothetical protein IH840_13370 [Candidatus Heimdallarchaeota archaeon]|nr:hypothetical protein [Candidatus Heimdallarchaeota archaeon]